ncbi:MAG: hypothetical protein ACK42Z_00640 [Candidatus Kapaibacteriota bacterium]
MKSFSQKILSLHFIWLFSFVFCFSQADTTSYFVTKQNDTLSFNLPIKSFGEFPYLLQTKSIAKTKFVAGDFVSTAEIIEKYTHHKLLTFGALGYNAILNQYGVLSYLNAFQNTAPHYLLPGYNSSFELFPTLLLDKVEILDGSNAILLGKHSAGISLNFKTRIFNTSVPYTQIWIGQAGYDFLGSSGLFSQNIARNLNFYFLYHRYWSRGRYSNSNADRWNIVTGVRWFPSSYLNLYLEHKYTNINYGLFGGLNPEKSLILFDKNFSTVNFENLKNKIYQNDLSFRFIYKLQQDSSVYFDGSVSFLFSKQNYNLEDFLAEYFRANKIIQNSCSNLQGNFKLVSNKPKYNFLLGVEFEKRNQNEFLTYANSHSFEPSAFAIFNKKLLKKFFLQVGTRIDFSSNDVLYKLGSRFTYSLSDSTDELYFDITHSSKNFDNLFDQSQLAILGFNQVKENHQLSAELYTRIIANFKTFGVNKDSLDNPIGLNIISTNNTKVIGVNFKSLFSILENLTFGTKINLFYTAKEKLSNNTLPFLIWNNQLSYRFKRGRSYLEIGLEFELYSPFNGAYIHPFYSVPAKFNSPRQWQHNGVSTYAHAKLGNAYVNISLRNLFSVNYYLIPIYPEYDRNLRITVFWSFND